MTESQGTQLLGAVQDLAVRVEALGILTGTIAVFVQVLAGLLCVMVLVTAVRK